MAKAYLQGFMKGYSNGEYCTDRNMKATSKITKTGALSCLKLLKDKSLRAKISPDGQLIRTKKLPKNADDFPYILESFPNEYYEWKLYYQNVTVSANGKEINLINLKDYASPKEIDNLKGYGNFTEEKKQKMKKWVDGSKFFIKKLLNVDYRTINDEWINNLIAINPAYQYNEFIIRRSMSNYLTNMKKNRTIVECNSVDVDGSTLYFYNDSFYLRIHVKYRIRSSASALDMSVDDLLETRAHNNILFSPYFVNLRGRTLDKWQDGYYEVELGEYDNGIDGYNIRFDDADYKGKKVSNQ